MSDSALASALLATLAVRDKAEPWMASAACKGMGPDKFFLDRGQSPKPGQDVCAKCSVTTQCKTYSRATNNEHGIWGGEVISRGSESDSPETFTTVQGTKVIPVSFSASAFQKFVDCPAAYKVESFEKTPMLSGSAASLGTSCHTAAEVWIADGHYLKNHTDEWAVMQSIYQEAYFREFADAGRLAEGSNLMKNWLARQNWAGRTVLSAEVKENFILQTSAGKIPVNYIMDRVDRLDDGSIEVIDYKSLSRPVQPVDLKRKIQSRLYALAAQMKYPDATRIWVTFDMLRYDPVGIVFTIEENRETYRFLKKLAEEIIASDGSVENLNDGCRWCIRKSICSTIQRHAAAGGSVGISDAAAAAERSYRLRCALDAMKVDADEMDKIVLAHMERENLEGFATGDLDVSVSVSGRRQIDPERLLQVVGPEIMSRYATINVTAVDAILKNEGLTNDQKSTVRQLFRTNYSEPSIKIKRTSPF